jgi:hypothetical protein
MTVSESKNAYRMNKKMHVNGNPSLLPDVDHLQGSKMSYSERQEFPAAALGTSASSTPVRVCLSL